MDGGEKTRVGRVCCKKKKKRFPLTIKQKKVTTLVWLGMMRDYKTHIEDPGANKDSNPR